MRQDWLATAAQWQAAGHRFVILTVLGVRGSAPVETGRRMLVAARDQAGTVGGGRLEQELVTRARQWLTTDAVPDSLVSLSLGARLGQCCGGKVTVHFELVMPVAAALAVFGAGHVAQQLVPILARLGRPVRCLDARLQWLERLPQLPEVEACHESDPVAAVRDLPAGSACLVLTHQHDLDLEICRALLARGDLAYVGVIGSVTKGNRFRAKLAAWGLPAERLECPVGAPVGKQPAAVAIAMAARICQVLRDSLRQEPEPDKVALRLLDQLVREVATEGPPPPPP